MLTRCGGLDILANNAGSFLNKPPQHTQLSEWQTRTRLHSVRKPHKSRQGADGNPGYTPRISVLEDGFKASWLATCPDFQTGHGYGRCTSGQASPRSGHELDRTELRLPDFTIEVPLKDNADLPMDV